MITQRGVQGSQGRPLSLDGIVLAKISVSLMAFLLEFLLLRRKRARKNFVRVQM